MHQRAHIDRRWLFASVLLAGCTGAQSALDTRGPNAASIATLWWVMFGLAVFVLAAFFLLIGWALFRRRPDTQGVDAQPHLDDVARADDPGALTAARARRLVAWGGAGVPAALLFVLLVCSVVVSRQVSAPPPADALVIDVTGHQYWWDVRYAAHDAGPAFRTANEIRLPVGQPAVIRLHSLDVIHSFWIPNLHGKLDMIPGRENRLVLQADSAGVFRGQCAEYCGVQHANMALHVVALPAADFESWREAQVAPARVPADSLQRAGERAFMETGCAVCHAVRGTEARAETGPDLTHFGSRLSIAAGTLPNRPGHLGGWITDPQRIKPGNLMPALRLDGSAVVALVAYLESLQ